MPNSKLIDAPPHRTSLAEVVAEARNFDLAVVHTSTPSFASDVKAISALKAANPTLKAGLIGAKAAVDAEGTLKAAPIVDFAARNEFDFTIKEVADGRDWKSIQRPLLPGRQWPDPAHAGPPDLGKHGRLALRHASLQARFADFPIFQRLSEAPLHVLLHRARLQIALHVLPLAAKRWRASLPHRFVAHVIEEMAWAKKAFPEVKEFFFDDDTFTDDLPRAEAIARELGKLGVTWSCTAKANVPRASLKVMRENGLRLLLVGYETGNQQILYNIKKGMRINIAKKVGQRWPGARRHHPWHVHHGSPRRDAETIKETIEFAKEVNPHTLQVVRWRRPIPGTFLYKQALENGWLDDANADLVNEDGRQIAPLSYPGLSHTEIFNSVETFYRSFYFRPSKIAAIVGEMATIPDMLKRRLREGVEFFRFLRERREIAH